MILAPGLVRLPAEDTDIKSRDNPSCCGLSEVLAYRNCEGNKILLLFKPVCFGVICYAAVDNQHRENLTTASHAASSY